MFSPTFLSAQKHRRRIEPRVGAPAGCTRASRGSGTININILHVTLCPVMSSEAPAVCHGPALPCPGGNAAVSGSDWCLWKILATFLRSGIESWATPPWEPQATPSREQATTAHHSAALLSLKIALLVAIKVICLRCDSKLSSSTDHSAAVAAIATAAATAGGNASC